MIPITSYHRHASQFIDACEAVGALTVTERYGIDMLARKLQPYWSRLVAWYPLVGGAAATHKFNLKDARDADAAYRLTFTGGITHDVNGMLGNGTTGFANTHINPNTIAQQNLMLGFYSRTNSNSASANIDMGCSDGSTQTFLRARNLNLFGARVGSNVTVEFATAASLGHHHIRRSTSGLNLNLYKTGEDNFSANSFIAHTNRDIYLMARNNAGVADLFTVRQHSSDFVMFDIAGADDAIIKAIDDAFQTYLGRNV